MTRRAPQFEAPYWYVSAPCASVGDDFWFPEANGMGNDAKKVCGMCRYKAPCLAGAVERGELFGIWGGVAIQQYRKHRGPVREAS